MPDVKWIKIVTDIFDDEKIQIIESMPEGDALALIWFKLLCIAGKTNERGVLMLTDNMPYTEDMLATIFRRDVKIVKLALGTFERLEMVEIVENAVRIINWEKHQNAVGLDKIREQTKARVQKHREAKRLPEPCNVTCNDVVTQSNAPRVRTKIEIKNEESEKRPRFSPPCVEDVQVYCDERRNGIDAQTFVDFYTTKGWKVGKEPMKDWKACVRTWEQRRKNDSPRQEEPAFAMPRSYDG